MKYKLLYSSMSYTEADTDAYVVSAFFKLKKLANMSKTVIGIRDQTQATVR